MNEQKIITREQAHQMINAFYDAAHFHGDVTFSFRDSVAYRCGISPTAKSKLEIATALALIEKYQKEEMPEVCPSAPKDG